MIYLDTSVAVAHLLSEDRRPAASLWDHPLIASKLLEYELWVRLNKLGVTAAQRETAQNFLGRIALIELIPEILGRAREGFAGDVRTLDAFHLASAAFLLNEGVSIEMATYDDRMRAGARRLGIPLYESL